MRTVYSISHNLLCTRRTVAAKVLYWFTAVTIWDGDRSTDRLTPLAFQPKGYTPAWCSDAALVCAITEV